jgi:hypothetical protein
MKNVKKAGRLELINQEEGCNIGLFQHIFKFVGPERGVDVDQHRSHGSGRKLNQDPFWPVRGPNSDMLARVNAERHERTGRPLNLSREFRIVASVLELRKNKSVAI